MRLEIKVYPSARRDKVVEENGRLKVYTSAPADKGKANRQVLVLLSDYLGLKKSQLKIIRGRLGRNKIIAVEKET